MNILPWSSVLQQLLSTKNLDFEKQSKFDHSFYRILHTHFRCYLIWSILNMLLIVLVPFQNNDQWWAFFLMCASWGGINLAIYLFLYRHTYRQQLSKSKIWEKLQIQWHLENMLWLNIGLDVAYVMAGGILVSIGLLSSQPHAGVFLGLGWAVMVQGFILFLFDIYFRYAHYKNHVKFKAEFFRQIDSIEIK